MGMPGVTQRLMGNSYARASIKRGLAQVRLVKDRHASQPSCSSANPRGAKIDFFSLKSSDEGQAKYEVALYRGHSKAFTRFVDSGLASVPELTPGSFLSCSTPSTCADEDVEPMAPHKINQALSNLIHTRRTYNTNPSKNLKKDFSAACEEVVESLRNVSPVFLRDEWETLIQVLEEQLPIEYWGRLPVTLQEGILAEYTNLLSDHERYEFQLLVTQKRLVHQRLVELYDLGQHINDDKISKERTISQLESNIRGTLIKIIVRLASDLAEQKLTDIASARVRTLLDESGQGSKSKSCRWSLEQTEQIYRELVALSESIEFDYHQSISDLKNRYENHHDELVKIQADLEALLMPYNIRQERVLNSLQNALIAEQQLINELVEKAIAARDRGDEDLCAVELEQAHLLLRLQYITDEMLMGQVLGVHSYGRPPHVQTRSITVRERGLNPKVHTRINDIVQFMKRREAWIRLDETLASLTNKPNQPNFIPYEPTDFTEAKDFQDMVGQYGLTAGYIPVWETRAILPLDFDEVLLQTENKTLLVTPGSGGVKSDATSSVIAAMNLARADESWKYAPVLIDTPFHGLASRDSSLIDKENLEKTKWANIAWQGRIVMDLAKGSGKKVRLAGRSTGGLFAALLAKYFSEYVECAVPMSPPSSSLAWAWKILEFDMHYLHEMLSKGDGAIPEELRFMLPSAESHAWFNGPMTAFYKHFADGTPLPGTLEKFGFLRLAMSDFETRDQKSKMASPVMFIYGMDDDQQYPNSRVQVVRLFNDAIKAFVELAKEQGDAADPSIRSVLTYVSQRYPGQSLKADNLQMMDLPLNEVWLAVAKKHSNWVVAFGIPGGHLQFPKGCDILRRAARDVAQIFMDNPTGFFDPDQAPQLKAQVEAILQPFWDARQTKLDVIAKMKAQGTAFDKEILVMQGQERLRLTDNHRALDVWNDPQFQKYYLSDEEFEG